MANHSIDPHSIACLLLGTVSVAGADVVPYRWAAAAATMGSLHLRLLDTVRTQCAHDLVDNASIPTPTKARILATPITPPPHPS